MWWETAIAILIVLLAAVGIGVAAFRSARGKSGCAGCPGCGPNDDAPPDEAASARTTDDPDP